MKRSLALTSIFIFACCLGVAASDSPDWARRTFAAPPNRVYQLALASIERQKHRINSQHAAAHTIHFHVGATAWSWGYNMTMTITPAGEGSTAEISIDRSGGKAVSWGSGHKEVGKIFRWMDEQLATPKPNGK
jgi:hypothetical protein